MNRFVWLTAVALTGALALPGASVAAPKLKAKPSFSGGRVVVTVTSGKKFTRRTRPRSVKLRTVGATYWLARVAHSARRSVWRTGAIPASGLAQLSGTPARIFVRTKAG